MNIPKIDIDKVKPLKAKLNPYMPEVDELPVPIKPEVINKWSLFIIHFKKWINSLTRDTATIGFNSLFSKAKVAMWWAVIIIGIAIAVKILTS